MRINLHICGRRGRAALKVIDASRFVISVAGTYRARRQVIYNGVTTVYFTVTPEQVTRLRYFADKIISVAYRSRVKHGASVIPPSGTVMLSV